MVPQSPHSGSASMLAVLATFYNSVREQFVLLKEDIHRFITSTEFFLSDIRGRRYKGKLFLWDTR